MIKIADLEFVDPTLIPNYLERLAERTNAGKPNWHHANTDTDWWGCLIDVKGFKTLLVWNMALRPDQVKELLALPAFDNTYSAKNLVLNITRTLFVVEIELQEGEVTPSGWSIIEHELDNQATNS